MIERKRHTKLAQNNHRDAPVETDIPNGVVSAEVVTSAVFILFVLLMMTVQITTPMNRRPEPRIANMVESKYVYVRFGIPVTIANAAQILPSSSR